MGNSVQGTGNNSDLSTEDGKPEMKDDGISNERWSETGETTNFIGPYTNENIKDAYHELKDELKHISTTNKFILKRVNEQQMWRQSLSKELAMDRKNPIKAELGDTVTKDDQARAPSDLLEKVVTDLQLRERNMEGELTMMKCGLKMILKKLDRMTAVGCAEARHPDVKSNQEFDTWIDSVNNCDEDEGILIGKEDCDCNGTDSENLHEKDNCDIEEMGKKCFVEPENTSSSDHMITNHAVPPGNKTPVTSEDKTVPVILVTPVDKTVAETLELTVEGVGAKYDDFDLTDEQSDFGTKLHRLQTLPSQDNRIAFSYDLKPIGGFVDDQTDHDEASNGSKSILKSVSSSKTATHTEYSSMRSEVQGHAVKDETELALLKRVQFTDAELNIAAPSSSERKTRSAKSEKVSTNIDDLQWAAWARQENAKALSSECPRSEGIFTVLLLDISASMSGCMKQMKDAVKQFLKGVEKVAIDDSFEENVAIATFGHETRVVQHLTNNYTLLREALETLTSGGRSPLFAGLVMAVSAFVDLETVGAVSWRPRVIVFTDGRITDSQTVKGPDHTTSVNQAVVKANVLSFCKDMKKKVMIHCVQTDDFDRSLMFDVTKMTMGKLFLWNDITKLSRTFRSIAYVDKIIKSSPGDSISGSDFMLAAQSIPGTSMEDVMAMFEIIERGVVESDNSEDRYKETDDRTMLPLGTRVRRGPDWSWGDQGKDTVGTIIGHANDEWIWVQWDNSNINRYCYGRGQHYDVISADEPRLLKDELIAVGCLVKRGKNWTHGDQDGGKGSIGVVLQVKSSGIIKVRWPSRTQADYRFGFDGHFDVDICDPFEVKDTMSAVGGATVEDKIFTERKNEKNASKGTLTIDEMNRRNTQCSVDIATSGHIPVKPNTETEPGKIKSKDVESSQTMITFQPVEEKNDKNTEVVKINEQNNKYINGLQLNETDKEQTAPVRFSAIGQQVTHQTPDKTSVFLVQGTESSSDTSRASSPNLDVASDRNKAEWNWMDATGNWQPYSADVTKDIERAFAKRPNSTKIIQLNGEIYRVIFTSMQQVNTTSRQTHNIRRIVITDE